MQGPLSLTGEWTGVYDYAGTDEEAVTFTASLNDVAGVIWGDTREPNSFAPTAATELQAVVSGVRSGFELRFRKEYIGDVPGGEDIVAYAGHISANGNRITGTWRITIPGFEVSGPFVMNRLPGTTTSRELEKSASARVER